MRKTLHLAFAVALVLALAACSSSSSDGSKTTATTKPKSTSTTSTSTSEPTRTTIPGTGPLDEYGKDIGIGLTNSDKASGRLLLTSKQASCVGPKWAKAIGAKQLHHGGDPAAYKDPGYDYSALGLSEAQATGMVSAFDSCGVDLYARFLDTVGQGLPANDQDCIARHLSTDTVRRLLIAGLRDSAGSALRKSLQDVGKACNLNGG